MADPCVSYTYGEPVEEQGGDECAEEVVGYIHQVVRVMFSMLVLRFWVWRGGVRVLGVCREGAGVFGGGVLTVCKSKAWSTYSEA